ncbi:MAG: dienelactone hydrolase family protein [Planctomycetes bacterium]|nr:dienelactone hydrolase family protein [Planctomycetota bacterium]
MDAYVARPAEGGPWPGVIVFQEIFGVNEHIREVCKRVAAQGYVAMAPDIYHRSVQRLELGYEAADIAEGRRHKDLTTFDGLMLDVKECILQLRNRDDVRGDALGAVGFCFGGHVAFLAATRDEIRATACFYGGGISTMRPGGGEPSLKLAPGIKGRVLMLYGSEDQGIPPEQVDEVRNALAEAGLRYEVKVIVGAQHGFACDKRLSYNYGACTEAWESVFTMWAQEFAQG